MARFVKLGAAGCLWFLVGVSLAQQGAPITLDGRWKAPNSSNTLSLRIDSLAVDGTFQGSLTVYGFRCIEKDLLVVGTLLEESLSFKAAGPARCADWPFEMKKGKDHAFEGFAPHNTFAINPASYWLDVKR